MPEEQKQEKKQEPEQPKTKLDELRDTMAELKELQESLNKQKEELLTLKEDQLLSGTAGARPQMEAKEETATEYMNKVMGGGLNAKAREE